MDCAGLVDDIRQWDLDVVEIGFLGRLEIDYVFLGSRQTYSDVERVLQYTKHNIGKSTVVKTN